MIYYIICMYAHVRENNHGSLTINHGVRQVLCETCLDHEYTKTRGWHSQNNLTLLS